MREWPHRTIQPPNRAAVLHVVSTGEAHAWSYEPELSIPGRPRQRRVCMAYMMPRARQPWQD